MPRRGYVSRRVVAADPVFGDVLVAKMIHAVMLQGKARVAERLVYGSLEILKEKTKEDPVAVLKKAIENAKPMVEVKSRRVGGATYQVPIEIRDSRREALATRWIIGAARGRAGKAMADKLAQEFTDAFNNQGTAVKKKEDTHKMAEANKAFAHYRW